MHSKVSSVYCPVDAILYMLILDTPGLDAPGCFKYDSLVASGTKLLAWHLQIDVIVMWPSPCLSKVTIHAQDCFNASSHGKFTKCTIRQARQRLLRTCMIHNAHVRCNAFDLLFPAGLRSKATAASGGHRPCSGVLTIYSLYSVLVEILAWCIEPDNLIPFCMMPD